MKKWPFFSHIKPFLPLIAAATLLMGLATGLKGFLAILVGPVMDYVLVPDPPDRVLLGTLPLLSKEIYLEQINPFPFDVPWLVVDCWEFWPRSPRESPNTVRPIS